MAVNSKTTLVQSGKGCTYSLLGDLYTLLATGENTDGAYGLVEVVMQPQGMIPAHSHDYLEAHYVLEGEVEYQLDEQTIVATSGSFIHFPKGQSHGFRNIQSQPAKLLMWVTPAGGEQFFAEVGQPVNLPMSEEEKHILSQPPSPADIEKAVEIASTKYGLTFAQT
jgi:quercetin dioxygenase-like cupin family protein